MTYEDTTRVRVQLNRIFALGPEVLPRALAVLAEFPELSQAFFSNGLSLQASAKAPKVR